MRRVCWNAVIIDDERLARTKLRKLLSIHPDVNVIGEAEGVTRAAEIIAERKPNILFLDVQMPGETGFDLLKKIPSDLKVVFVTAFDEYAIRAFEVNALDYLLKPVSPQRLAASLQRLNTSAAQVKTQATSLAYDDHIFVSGAENASFIKVSTIRFVRASGVYSEIHTSDGKKDLVLRPLKEWEERLPPNHFARIHRSVIVNLEYVSRMEKGFNKEFMVYVKSERRPLIMSRRYAAKVKNRLK